MNSKISIELEDELSLNRAQFFDLYHRNSFKEAARNSWIDGWKIEYMAIAEPATLDQIPTVIVGGAFQNFNSYKYCVEQLFEKGPVILIDLPSLGSNQQLYNTHTGVSAAMLELPDLAVMLGQWLDMVGIAKVSIMGLSLGSVVASCFAHARPELVDRMILMGVMQKTRKSWRMLLEESLLLMKEQRMEEFGQAVILYLVNHAKLDRTRMSPTAKKLFYKQMSGFDPKEQERYEINCNRLLRLQHVPIPSCKTLVACGQYDSFTLPYENANFALQCPDAEFAMIANADHVPQLQRRKETMNLFTSYLKGESIENIEGVIHLNRTQMQQLERRGELRYRVQQPQTVLKHRHLSLQVPLQIETLNYFGVAVQLDQPEQSQVLNQYSRDLALRLSDEQGDFWVEGLIFEVQQGQARILFKHGSFEIAERLLKFIEQQKQALHRQFVCET